MNAGDLSFVRRRKEVLHRVPLNSLAMLVLQGPGVG